MLRRVVLAYNSRPPIMDYLQRAFEKRGIAVRQFNMETNHWFDRLLIHNIDKQLWNLRVLPKGRSAFEGHPLAHLQYRSAQLEELVNEFEPDLFFIVRGWRVTEQVLQRIRKKCFVIGWWIEQEKRMEEAFREIALYDYYFFINSSCVEEGHRRGYRNIGLLHHAVDPASFYPLADVPRTYDCCFVGKWSEKRQSFMERVVNVTDSVAIYGPKWRKHNLFNGRILKAVKGDYVGGSDLVRLYNASRVVLNMTNWGSDGASRSGMNMRVLEVPACRTFLLTDGSRDIGSVVDPGRHVVVYEGLADFEGKLRYYLQYGEARAAIAEEGYRHVTTHYTYDTVVGEILRVWASLSGERRQLPCLPADSTAAFRRSWGTR